MQNQFNRDTLLITTPQGQNITVADVLSAIDEGLTFLRGYCNIDTEPFSTAIKVMKCLKRLLLNQPTEPLSPKDLEFFIDALEQIESMRSPNERQEIAQQAWLYKQALKLFINGHI